MIGETDCLYQSPIPYRIIRLVELLLGLLVGYFWSMAIDQKLDIGYFYIAGPLLAIALLGSALRSKKLKKICYEPNRDQLILDFSSIWKMEQIVVPIQDIQVQLKKSNKKSRRLFEQVQLVFWNAGNQIATLTSLPLSIDHSTLLNLYRRLAILQSSD